MTERHVFQKNIARPDPPIAQEAEARRLAERIRVGRDVRTTIGKNALADRIDHLADALAKAEKRLAAAESKDGLQISQAYGDQLGEERRARYKAEQELAWVGALNKELNERHTFQTHRAETAEAQLRDLREAIATALTSLATGPGKNGYAYAVLDAALQATQEDGAA